MDCNIGSQGVVAQLTLAVAVFASSFASAQTQAMPTPPAGRYLCGVGGSSGSTSTTNYGSSQARLTLDGSNYLYETGAEPRRDTYRYDGVGKLLFVTGDLAGSTADWERSPWGKQLGRFWFKGVYCDLSTS
jgi:hypothetical protein